MGECFADVHALVRMELRGCAYRTASTEKRALAKERRAKKEVPDAESDSMYGVLTSPRDKPASRRPGTSRCVSLITSKHACQASLIKQAPYLRHTLMYRACMLRE